ncbi:MAG: hypothetical protein GY801_09940 [bacterium]|nr:hypothetical protein [bacterium]
MKTQLITMLTHNDQTVENALEVFNECKKIDNNFWGFKDVGLPKEKMKELTNALQEAGKTTFLEVVSYSEEECMTGAKLAAEVGFDYLMGTIFYESVWEFLKENDMKFLPFVGKVHSSPSILEGSIEEIIAQGKEIAAKGVAGFDLLAYRHVDDPEKLAKEFAAAMDIPVVIAGSIDSPARIDFVEEIGAWAYTIGGAFFEEQFVKEGGFRGNLEYVVNYMAGK